MQVFWDRGYAATSMRDLTDELGLNPSSLYRAFADKHTLFLRALDRYTETESAALREAIRAGGPLRTTLRDWLLGLIDELCVDRRGCMLVNAATELASSDPATQARAQAAFAAIRDALETVLDDAQRGGELNDDLDPAASAELLLNLVIGLKVQGRVGAPRERLERAVGAALAGLTGDARPAT
jgi:TetR/AcrR family transcriptional repressor of nem operon